MAGAPRISRGGEHHHDDPNESSSAEDREPSPRRKTNNGGLGPLGLLNGGTPWWAKFIIVILFYFGLPTLIVGVLLAMGAGWIPSPITDTHKLAQDLKDQIYNTQKRDERMGRFLALICRNTSYTETQRADCERIVQMDTR